MTRPVLIGVVAAVLLIGGGAAYTLTKDDDSPSQSSSGSQNTQSDASFAPQSTEGLEFKATITTTSGGNSTQATLEYDDKKNTRYVANTGGQQMEFIFTSDTYYSCQGGNCVKYPITQASNSGIDPSTYTYDQNELAGYRTGSSYKGRQSCPAGTCDVWSVNTGGTTSTIFIDTNTKRISQVEGSQGGATSTIVYEYTDVTINVPTNARSL